MQRFVLCLVGMLICSSARAEVAAMLSVKRDPATSEQDEWAVTHAVTDFFAQRETPVVLPSQAAERLGARYEPCDMLPCASGYLERLQADFAVGAVIFADEGRVQAVNIAIIQPNGLAYTGSAKVDDGAVNKAGREAIALAWERFQRGPGPWLEVRGEAGHRLRVDEELRGALPYRDRITAGVHQLVVEGADGQPYYEATVRIPDDAAQYTVVDAAESNVRGSAVAEGEPAAEEDAPVAIQPAAAPGERRDASEVSPYNYVAGGSLLAVGGFGLGVGVFAALNDGECVGETEPRCEAYAFEAREKAFLGLGAALAAAGVVWLAWRPLRATPSVQAGPDHAVLYLQGEF